MKKYNHTDGSWGALLAEWERECHTAGQDFKDFAPETMDLLGDLVQETENERWNGVYGVPNETGRTRAVCFVNGAFIPGFSGRVLRVRHILLSPECDFGDFDEHQYARLLGEVFERIIQLSDNEVPCPHVKLHFRSPADVALFSRFSREVSGSEHFSDVKMIGAWLILTKKQLS